MIDNEEKQYEEKQYEEKQESEKKELENEESEKEIEKEKETLLEREIENKLYQIKNLLSSDASTIEKYKQLMTIITNTNTNANKSRLTKWQLAWMEELDRENNSLDSIAKKLNISMTSVRYHLIPGEPVKIRHLNKIARDKRKNNPISRKAWNDYNREYQRNLSNEKRRILFNKIKQWEEESDTNKSTNTNNDNDKLQPIPN